MQYELAEETKGKIAPELIAHAWDSIVLTNDVSRDSLETFVTNAKAAGLHAADARSLATHRSTIESQKRHPPPGGLLTPPHAPG